MPVSTMLQSLPQALPDTAAAGTVELADTGAQAAAHRLPDKGGDARPLPPVGGAATQT